jgi:hypothetical protein
MRFKFAIFFIAIQAINTLAIAQISHKNSCNAVSGLTITPVVELYTSEGCSSCPPADKWLSTLKPKNPTHSVANPAVIQAFHVNYWDYIGWPDRFATPAHTNRQRQVSAWNRQNGIYTPQMVLNGGDWRGWGGSARNVTASLVSEETAKSNISLQQTGFDQFEAVITPVQKLSDSNVGTWSAYWTITEHGHTTKVKAGENKGETLLHDYVVRQYTPVGDYSAAATQKLTLRSVPATAGHERQVNLVVFDPKTGKTIQAISASCS